MHGEEGTETNLMPNGEITMKETLNGSRDTTAPYMLPVSLSAEKKTGLVTEEIILDHALEESRKNLQREGLTSLQQLNKSGNLLLESMERVLSSSKEKSQIEMDDGTTELVTKEFKAEDVVACAHALAATVQSQTNLVKVMKGFLK